LKREVTQACQQPDVQDIGHQAADALAASVTEFILEGLHVHNRLNKHVKGGETVFKR
jgi:magnesium chelatase subunit I